VRMYTCEIFYIGTLYTLNFLVLHMEAAILNF